MLLTTPFSKFVATFICAIGVLICLVQYTSADPTPTPTPTPCAPAPTSTPATPTPIPRPVDVNIVAHQDDDILFLNPDILNSVVAGHRQVTVFITSGSLSDPCYALHREEGAMEGYQKLLQLADAIIAHPNHFNDLSGTFHGDSKYPAGCASPTPHCFPCAEHADELSSPPPVTSMERQTLSIGSRSLATAHSDDGRVLLIFLRVQVPCAVDGNFDPVNPCPNQVDLATLFTSPDNNLQIESTFVGEPGYTRQQLRDTLVEILNFVRPSVVRTQDTADGIVVDYPGTHFIPNLGCQLDDYLGYTNPQFYDHSDHVWGARFANEAVRRYNRLPNIESPTYSNYRCYNLEWNEALKTRVSTKDFCLKKSIFFRYAVHDDDIIADGFSCFFYWYIGYQKGQPKNLH